MTQPCFDSTISLGHIVQIMSLVIAGATAWGVHTSTLRHLELLRNEDRKRIESNRMTSRFRCWSELPTWSKPM